MIEEFCFPYIDHRCERNDLLFRKMSCLICSGDFKIQQRICGNACLSALTSPIITFYLLFFQKYYEL